MPRTALATPGAPGKVACSILGCRETFVRQHDMERHIRNTHFGKKLRCPIFPGQECGFRGAVREHLVRRHIKEKHPEFCTFHVRVPRGVGHRETQFQQQNPNAIYYAFTDSASWVEVEGNDFSQLTYFSQMAPRSAM
ncbi:hypothetical protein BGZ60DRAFT_563316 [Tricladium varicosporioides]|nr:hypothetical protein BGZ60DRAFT_563316 [Hymenoscyphus varicosporioides]